MKIKLKKKLNSRTQIYFARIIQNGRNLFSVGQKKLRPVKIRK